MVKFPCQNCPDRHIGCHSECEKYKAAKIAQRIQHNAEAKAKQADQAARDVCIQGCIRWKRHHK